MPREFSFSRIVYSLVLHESIFVKVELKPNPEARQLQALSPTPDFMRSPQENWALPRPPLTRDNYLACPYLSFLSTEDFKYGQMYHCYIRCSVLRLEFNISELDRSEAQAKPFSGA